MSCVSAAAALCESAETPAPKLLDLAAVIQVEHSGGHGCTAGQLKKDGYSESPSPPGRLSSHRESAPRATQGDSESARGRVAAAFRGPARRRPRTAGLGRLFKGSVGSGSWVASRRHA